MNTLIILLLVLGWIVAIPIGKWLISGFESFGNEAINLATSYGWAIEDTVGNFPFIDIKGIRKRKIRVAVRLAIGICLPLLAVILIAVYLLEITAAIIVAIARGLWRCVKTGWNALKA